MGRKPTTELIEIGGLGRWIGVFAGMLYYTKLLRNPQQWYYQLIQASLQHSELNWLGTGSEGKRPATFRCYRSPNEIEKGCEPPGQGMAGAIVLGNSMVEPGQGCCREVS